MTLSRRILFTVFAPVAVFFLRLSWASFRFRVDGEEKVQHLIDERRPFVFAFFHESLLTVGWYAARLRDLGAKVGFLISPSVDGEFTVYVLGYFKGTPIRGSATRSGAAAIRGLYRAITRDGVAPGITVDGPKGPRRHCKKGAVMIAGMTGVPIVPIATGAKHCWRPKTWDRHLMPFPLSRVVVAVGDPYTVSKEGGVEVLEDQRADLEERIHRLVERAEELAGNTSTTESTKGRNHE